MSHVIVVVAVAVSLVASGCSRQDTAQERLDQRIEELAAKLPSVRERRAPTPPAVPDAPTAAAPASTAALERHCEAGDHTRCAALVDRLSDGFDPGHDPARAAALGRAACDAGEQLACAILGRLLAKGEGVTPDVPAGARLARGACEADEPRGCYELALMHETTLPPDQNAKNATALALYDKACSLGSSDGCDELGQAWYSGRGGAGKDMAKAAAAYGRACALGDRIACHKQRKAQGQQ